MWAACRKKCLRFGKTEFRLRHKQCGIVSVRSPVSKEKGRKERKKKRVGWQGSKRRFAWAPSPWTHRGPGLQTSLVEDLCFLSTSRWRNTSLLLSQRRDVLLRGSSPPCVGVRGAASPGWWISCLMLLSWMIWGIIPKVSHFIFFMTSLHYRIMLLFFGCAFEASSERRPPPLIFRQIGEN